MSNERSSGGRTDTNPPIDRAAERVLSIYILGNTLDPLPGPERVMWALHSLRSLTGPAGRQLAYSYRLLARSRFNGQLERVTPEGLRGEMIAYLEGYLSGGQRRP